MYKVLSVSVREVRLNKTTYNGYVTELNSLRKSVFMKNIKCIYIKK